MESLQEANDEPPDSQVTIPATAVLSVYSIAFYTDTVLIAIARPCKETK
jgi:hypothetical protein